MLICPVFFHGKRGDLWYQRILGCYFNEFPWKHTLFWLTDHGKIHYFGSLFPDSSLFQLFSIWKYAVLTLSDEIYFSVVGRICYGIIRYFGKFSNRNSLLLWSFTFTKDDCIPYKICCKINIDPLWIPLPIS